MYDFEKMKAVAQRLSEALPDLASTQKTGALMAELVGRMFPNGYPKMGNLNINSNFGLVERPAMIADILVEDEYQRMRDEGQALN